MTKRTISVRRHTRRVPSGRRITVKKHKRRIDRIHPRFVSKSRFRYKHFQRDVEEREWDESEKSPYPNDPEIWFGDPESYDIHGIDDPLPENVYITKDKDYYRIGLIEGEGKDVEYKETTRLEYSVSDESENTLNIDGLYSSKNITRGKGMGTLLMREFLKDSDEKEQYVTLYSDPGGEYSMDPTKRSNFYRSFGFHYYMEDEDLKNAGGPMYRPPVGYQKGDLPPYFEDEDYGYEKADAKHERKWRRKPLIRIKGSGEKIKI